MAPILEMRGITKTFPGVKALDNVNLAVAPAEIHALVGENGAGKSTLMKVLSGVYPHGSFEGAITFDGREEAFSGIHDSERRGIIIIHQELALVPLLSIAENIFLGNEISHGGVIDWTAVFAQTRELLRIVGLDEDPETLVTHLGVGKQQLVEIAKALSKQVRLLILDEPTASLNESDSDALLTLLVRFKAQGISSILISHKLNEIAKVADAVTVLRDGSTVETLPRNAIMTPAGTLDEDRIIRGMVGRDMAHRYPPRDPVPPGETLLELRDWSVHHPVHPERQVVRGASLTLRRGEVVGVAGLMGAGRTELAMSLFGRSYGQRISGTALVRGEPAARGRWRRDRCGPRTPGGRGLPHPPCDPLLGRWPGHHEPVGRQPAEGCAEQMALRRARHPHARRTDARRRCGGEIRDLHHRQRACRGRQGCADDLVRDARTARHVRPDLRHERGSHGG
jgi:putative multiple sugar transport system ATP-binding protein